MLSCLVVTCWKRAGLLTLLCVVFSCVFLYFVTFPYGVSGQVLYLVVSIPDLCLPLFFKWVCVLMSPHHGATMGLL